ncbi:MAG: hypothetical protein WCT49_01465 [Candidatus Paceibacterota bacterium]|jgi:hypothetical protein|nr:hypothetical protein [Candidatus Paceibacterota bacterium]
MTQLTKGMYGSEFHHLSELFGIHCGQMRCDKKITHNSGWYNRNGEKLGWGDLDALDFQRISEEIEEGETFIVLSEQDSFRNFVKRSGVIGSIVTVDDAEQCPGIEYMAEKALYVITRGKLYKTNRYDSGNKVYLQYGVSFELVALGEMKKLILS